MPVYLPSLTFGGLGYGGASYGIAPYGSGSLPHPPVVTTGGYGGAPYGFASYGSVDVFPPRVTGAVSLDGFRVEVFFSEEMDPTGLTAAGAYSFSETSGAPLTVVNIGVGVSGSHGGYTSVIVTHSGSTLGGQYTVTVTGPTDLALNPVGPPPTNSATFLAKGDTTTVQASLASPDDGRSVVLSFSDSRGGSQNLLTEAVFSPGVDDTATYAVSTDYPVTPAISSAEQQVDLSKVDLDVHPMTSTDYNMVVGPSEAFNYNGSLLPNDDPDFTGSEIGSGHSIAYPHLLWMGKEVGNQYGWSFGDTTGRMVPGSSYRFDLSYSMAGTTFAPPLVNSSLAVLSVSDGATQIDLTLRDIAGTQVIDVASGAYSAQVPADWSSAATPHTLSVLRNQQAGIYTLVFNGTPLLSFPIASATGAATYSAGSAFVFTDVHTVVGFLLTRMGVSASSTLFTSAWNFIHNLASSFKGSAVLTRDRIITKRGPLVRGWGDATPATKEDVTVRLDPAGATPAGEVDIASINPYVGEIYPTIPIPLAAAGTFSVEVDYIWFSNPAMEMVGLNTRGLTLNTWDRAVGHTPEAVSPLPSTSLGAPKTNRFPMGILLGPYDRPSPLEISHRYIGFQKGGYSALLNQPTTLLLNRSPNAISVGNVTAEALIQSGTFTAQASPVDSSPAWTLWGEDAGIAAGGRYTLIDSISGPYGVGQATIYQRLVDLSLPSSAVTVGRFKLSAWESDGVFTGVGVGIYDGAHLALIGAIQVSGMRHLGLLKDASQAHLESGWDIGPVLAAEATSTTTLEAPSLPLGFGAGSRFRIASGPQGGMYQIVSCGVDLNETTGNVEFTITPPLPQDPSQPECRDLSLLLEVVWDSEFISLRIYSDWTKGKVEAYVGGALSGLVASSDAATPFPAQSSLLLPASEAGHVVWGSISRRATSTSEWDLVQYSVTPERVLNTVQGITALTEMGTTPPNDPNDPWYEVGGFGYCEVDASGDTLLLKSTSASATPDVQFSFERTEPYLSPKVSFDGEATFKVESGILGAGDANFKVADTVREAQLSTLLYVENPGTRKLASLPQLSLSGLQDPSVVGWEKGSSNNLADPTVRGQTLQFTKEATPSGIWISKDYPTGPTIGTYNWEGAIIECRLSVESFVVGSLGIGFVFGGISYDPIASTSTNLSLGLGNGSVLLLDQAYNTISTIPFAWDDGEAHTYRLLCDPVANNVAVAIDDVIVGSVPHASFPSVAVPSSAAWVGGEGSGTFNATLHSASVVPLRLFANAAEVIGRTFGVLVGSDSQDINSYVIPRSDVSSLPNSSVSATPVEMDWRDLCRVRMYLDPGWGLSVYRPDLPLPPTATEDFATETTDPSAAWINVEYRDLPTYSDLALENRGSVSFGATNPRSITQQRWDSVRYRIRGAVDGFGIAPEGMVLNRAFTLTSGEFNLDTTPEVQTILSATSTTVVVSDSAIYADRVFVVQVDGVVVSTSQWTFDPSTQFLTLATPLSSPHHPVTVSFAPGQPVTKTYLCTQPIEESVTILNEGTPPVPTDLASETTREILAGSRINDPDDVLDEAESLVLNDPYRFIHFSDSGDSLYADLQFCTKDRGKSVHITSICDGPGPGLGLSHLELEGGFTSGATSVAEGPAGPWKGSPTIKGSATHFDPATVLLASGGVILGGTLGPGTAILYPNQRGPTGANPNGFGINQDFGMDLRDVTPRGESLDIPTLMGDNVPPTYAVAPAGEANPDGAPTGNGNGAVAYRLDDWSGTYSHLGPWGGLSSLSTNSLLAGGAQLNGTEFTLEGGSQIASPTLTTGYIRAAN